MSESFDDRFQTSLPLDLQTVGAGAGCLLHTSTEWILPVPTNLVGGATVIVPVPNLSILAGGTIYHSWLIADAGANFAGVTTTSGLRVDFGE